MPEVSLIIEDSKDKQTEPASLPDNLKVVETRGNHEPVQERNVGERYSRSEGPRRPHVVQNAPFQL